MEYIKMAKNSNRFIDQTIKFNPILGIKLLEILVLYHMELNFRLQN